MNSQSHSKIRCFSSDYIQKRCGGRESGKRNGKHNKRCRRKIVLLFCEFIDLCSEKLCRVIVEGDLQTFFGVCSRQHTNYTLYTRTAKINQRPNSDVGKYIKHTTLSFNSLFLYFILPCSSTVFPSFFLFFSIVHSLFYLFYFQFCYFYTPQVISCSLATFTKTPS